MANTANSKTDNRKEYELKKNYTLNEMSMDEFVEMTFSGLSTEEQETSINFYHGDDTMQVCTTDNVTLTKLKRIARTNPDAIKIKRVNVINGKTCGCTVEMPTRLLSLRSKISEGRTMTEEEKEAARERMKHAREAHS